MYGGVADLDRSDVFTRSVVADDQSVFAGDRRE